MNATRHGRALLALVAAGALGVAATAGTYALWVATASGEGTIAVAQYSFVAGTVDDRIAPNDGDSVRIPLPDELQDQLRDTGRGATVLSSLTTTTGDLTHAVDLAVVSDDPATSLTMDVRVISDSADCHVTTGPLSWSSGGTHRLEPADDLVLYCLEAEVRSTETSGTVTVTAATENGSVAAQENWSATVLDAFTPDTFDIVLTPVIEVAP